MLRPTLLFSLPKGLETPAEGKELGTLPDISCVILGESLPLRASVSPSVKWREQEHLPHKTERSHQSSGSQLGMDLLTIPHPETFSDIRRHFWLL